jgi:hypothetical protein
MVRPRPSLGRNPWLARLQAIEDQSTVRGRDEGGLRIKTRARASQIVRPRRLERILG